MPSPFPGMDPYLEGSLWQSVHHQLIAEIARQLVPLLRPRYMALSQERFVTVMSDPDEGVSILATGSIYPDVAVSHTGHPTKLDGAGSLAPLEMATLLPEQIPQVSLEIRDCANRELVTAIELLSPTNKTGDGFEEYLEKRGKYLLSRAHLIEIDLLRSGRRPPMVGTLPSMPYFAFISRAWKRPMTEIWPIGLKESLPTISVPLLGRDESVPLDLQAAFNNVYDQCGLDLAIDYSRPPEIPLTEGDAAKAANLLEGRRGP